MRSDCPEGDSQTQKRQLSGRLGDIPSAVWMVLISGLAVSGYLFTSHALIQTGFPLDDAWIHQTYARNLVNFGEFSFIPGEPSAGSTSPLWSFLLAAGYWIGLSPLFWTFFLGWLALMGLALIGMHTFQRLSGTTGIPPVWMGIFLVLEWHLLWAAVSGMETMLYAIFILVGLGLLLRPSVPWFWLGIWIGLSVWVRPDGLTLLGAVVWVLFFSKQSLPAKVAALGRCLVGIGIFLAPYLVFNFILSHSLWPNTLFAKQSEYAALREIPLLVRFGEQAFLPMVGGGAILLPGLLFFLLRSLKRRMWVELAGLAWLAGDMAMYAWRLPVTYQHGRYLIPAMPVFFVWGMAGMVELGKNLWPGRIRWVLVRAWIVSLCLLTASFLVMGAQAYARDVGIIETEMVATALWIQHHTPPSARIAAHDIGALGYFSGRNILDLAGLVSPQVIPFIRDEVKLAAFITENHADYLVTFPDWYPLLVTKAEKIYSTTGTFSPAAGGENMAVYRWPSYAILGAAKINVER